MTTPERELQAVWNDFHDHETFARESLAIRNKLGKTVPFELQPAQKRFNELVQSIRAKGRPVRIIVLKARQVMISTATAAHFFQECAFNPGQKALIVAHEGDASQNIFGYYEQFQSNYEPFRGVIGTLPVDRSTAKLLSYEGGGYIKVATANNIKTGRSFSLRHLHLSEYAFYRDAKTLMTGLMQCVPDDPETMVVIESTANGVGGEFHRLWQEANDPTVETEWVPFFFAWWEHPEYSIELTTAQIAAFQQTLTPEELELRSAYHLTIGQLAWRRWAIRNKCGGSADTFKQEYPSNPEEAFLTTGRPRFSAEHLGRMPAARKDAKTAGTPGELEERYNGPKPVIYFMPGERGPLVLYKKPVPGKRYVIGVDVCEGLTPEGSDSDYSVAQVVDQSTGEQVAKLRGRMEPAPFAEYVNALARWYNWAFLVPEANGPGIAFLEQLIRDNYPPRLIYHRRPSPDEQFADNDSTLLSRIGWKTSAVTRVQLIARHDQNIREFGIIIVDPKTLDEHQKFVIKPNGKAEAAEGSHDDEVIALALAGVGIEAAPADHMVADMKQQAAAAGVRPAAGTVATYRSARSYGRRDQPERRGTLIRF